MTVRRLVYFARGVWHIDGRWSLTAGLMSDCSTCFYGTRVLKKIDLIFGGENAEVWRDYHRSDRAGGENVEVWR